LIFGFGTGAFILGVLYFLYLYVPLGKAVSKYYLGKVFEKEKVLEETEKAAPKEAIPTPTLPPVPDTGFSIFVPKIGASAKVLPNIDAGNEEIYYQAIKEGVAHAASSGLPGSGKTIYLFAHSTNSQWNIVRYNAVFFLLNELEAEDEIIVVYNQKNYSYTVSDKKIVSGSDAFYLTDYQEGETLILQTCWPPGTTLKRLLVFAKPKQ